MFVSGDSLVCRVKKDRKLQDRFAPLLLAIFSVLTLYQLTTVWPYNAHDSVTHMRRIESLTEALQAGVVFPRWFPDLMFGYGKPVFNYYSPGFYYPVALLQYAGLELVSSMRIALSLGFGMSAWWMFRFLRLHVSLWPAIAGVICFQFFPYRIYDLFVRGAYPEFSAFIWLPLIALYTMQAATVDRKASTSGSLYPLLLAKAGLAWAGLILTHNLTALLAVLMLGAAVTLFTALRLRTKTSFLQVIGSSVAPVAIAMFLTAWYVLPALWEIDWVMNGRRLFAGIGMSHFLEWGNLFDFDLFYSYNSPQDRPRLPFYVIPIMLASLAAVLATRSSRTRLLTLVALPLTLGLCWMLTDTSSWLWSTGEMFLDQILFPWRWQIFAAFGAALLLAALIESLCKTDRTRAIVLPLLSLSASVYLYAYVSVGLINETKQVVPVSAHWSDSIDAWLAQATISPWGLHLLPVWSAAPMKEAATAGRKPWELHPLGSPNGSTAVSPMRAGLLQQEYLVTTDLAFRLLFHQFYFPSWRVNVDGVQAEVQPATGLGLASVTIPPGEHRVGIAWRETAAVRWGRVLTATGWLIVFIMLSPTKGFLASLRRGRRVSLPAARRWWLSVAWVAIGAFMVLAASGITVRHWDFSAIGADYGFVRLEGVRSIPPLRAGEIANVHLTWLAKGSGEPVSAFVHLVDQAGNVLSQYDGPPGGKHTPYDSWMPGLILYSTHNIAIPDSLPPGSYRLAAGLYYPDLANEPLVPVNGSSSRLEIGSLQVIP